MNEVQKLIKDQEKEIQRLFNVGLHIITTERMAKNGTLKFVGPNNEFFSVNIRTGWVRRFSNTSPYRNHIAYPLNPRKHLGSKVVYVSPSTGRKFYSTSLGPYQRLYKMSEQVDRILSTINRLEKRRKVGMSSNPKNW